MVKLDSMKVGAGVGFTLLGAYVSLNFSDDVLAVVAGIVLVAVGVSLIVSS